MTDFARAVDGMVSGALNPGERVLWTGHRMSRLGKQRGAMSFPVGVEIVAVPMFVCGVYLVVTSVVQQPDGRIAVGIALLLLGGWIVRSTDGKRPDDGAMYCRKQTVYVLTDQRAFVLKHCRTAVPMRSVDWRYVELIRVRKEHPDGRGTIEFVRTDSVSGRAEMLLTFSTVGNAFAVAEWARAAMATAHRSV
jgi:hypothetical protein